MRSRLRSAIMGGMALTALAGMSGFVTGAIHAMTEPANAHAAASQAAADPDAATDSNVELAQIKAGLARGRPAALQRYFGCGGGLGYDLIASGSSGAVALAVELLQHSDGCFSESLHSAIAQALQANPEAVLPYFNTGQLGQGDCIPFISAESAPGTDEAVFRRIEDALRGITRPELQAARAKCLAAVADYRRAVAAARQLCARLDAACTARRSQAGDGEADCTLCPDSRLSRD